MSNLNVSQIEKISSFDQLAKVFKVEYLVKLVVKDIKNKAYHKDRNKMIREFWKAHKEEFGK